MIREAFLQPHSQSKKNYVVGTHRTRSPADTLRAYMPLMPKMGITRLANVTGLDYVGLPVYQAVRPASRSMSVSQGKGVDAEAAKASALMEAIESWHAERIQQPIRTAVYADISQSEAVVEIRQLPWRWNVDIDLNEPIEWIEGYDLMTDQPTWIPYEAVSLNFTLAPGAETLSGGFHRTSTGLSSGNHLLEAIVHGICEVIERDATVLWLADNNAARAKESQVDLSTITNPACCHILELLHKADICVGVWEMTSDIGIPTYCAMIIDSVSWVMLGVFLGFGTHLDPEIALSRALTEAIQSRITDIAGSRDDILEESMSMNKQNAIEAFAKLQYEILHPAPARAFPCGPSLATDTFKGDVELLLEALAKVGITNAVALDISQPDIGIPVIKMIIPGLEIVRDYYRPGRRAQVVKQQHAALPKGKYSHVLASFKEEF